MKASITLLILCFVIFANGQSLVDFNEKRYEIDKKLMLTLTGWSVANVGVGAYGWSSTSGESKYFHQMNVMWSGVNLALSVPGLLKARKAAGVNANFSETYLMQTKTEKVFLFNTGLDLAYITGGFFLKQRALSDPENYQRYRGWGNSLVLQGSFLFLFDIAAVIIHSNHRKNKLDSFFSKLELSSSNNGIGLKLQL